MNGRRGSALTQVLVLAAIAGTISAGILRLTFSMHMTAHAGIRRLDDDLKARAAINRVTEVWSRGAFCASDADASVTCNAQACGACLCTADGTTVTTEPADGYCRLSATP